jgi:hypothetical protein
MYYLYSTMVKLSSSQKIAQKKIDELEAKKKALEEEILMIQREEGLRLAKKQSRAEKAKNTRRRNKMLKVIEVNTKNRERQEESKIIKKKRLY